MKAYSIDYNYNGAAYSAIVDAKDKDSAINKIGRKHKLNADQAKKSIRPIRISVVGYF